MLEAFALIGVAVITAGGAYLTNRQATRSARVTASTTVQGAVESARIVAEENAFERAKSFYESVIARQDLEVADLDREVAALRDGLAICRKRVEGLTVELAAAKAALRLRFPDEP